MRTKPRPAIAVRRRRPRWKRFLIWLLLAFAAYYAFVAAALLLLRWVNPPFTAVQVERRISSWRDPGTYTKRYRFVPLSRISPNLQHAVISAEDARFFEHHGFDWRQMQDAVEQDVEEGRRRGASTITQQLVRNLFLSTNRSLLRKAVEFSIVPLAEAILSKRRILELYLNVIEWGRGIFGAEAAAEFYYGVPAQRLTREQSIQLATILPAPLHRRPGHQPAYAARIQARMREMNW